MKYYNAILTILSLLLIAGCGVYLKFPKSSYQDNLCTITDEDTIELRVRKKNSSIDSIHWPNAKMCCMDTLSSSYKYVLQQGGHQSFVIKIYYSDGKLKTIHKTVQLVSAEKPITLQPDNYELIKHDTSIFTQGLIFFNDQLIETGGLYGQSSINKVNIENGDILHTQDVDSMFFAEGITDFNGTLRMLTWKEQMVFHLDSSLNIVEQNHYEREGWGLCHNDSVLIASDGSSKLYFLNPQDLREQASLNIYDDKGSVTYLNELEWINGCIWANELGEDHILIIDPSVGKVVARVDFTSIIQQYHLKDHGSFNGIAYDQKKQIVYLTGKKWPYYIKWKLPDKLR